MACQTLLAFTTIIVAYIYSTHCVPIIMELPKKNVPINLNINVMYNFYSLMVNASITILLLPRPVTLHTWNKEETPGTETSGECVRLRLMQPFLYQDLHALFLIHTFGYALPLTVYANRKKSLRISRKISGFTVKGKFYLFY